jgi:excisionase family DNA binding protein
VSDILTLEEAAARVKVKPRTIRIWLQTGKLKGIKAGKLWRIRAEDLEAFLEQSVQAAMHLVKSESLEAINAEIEERP